MEGLKETCCLVSVGQFAFMLGYGTTADGVAEIRIIHNVCLKGRRLVV